MRRRSCGCLAAQTEGRGLSVSVSSEGLLPPTVGPRYRERHAIPTGGNRPSETLVTGGYWELGFAHHSVSACENRHYPDLVNRSSIDRGFTPSVPTVPPSGLPETSGPECYRPLAARSAR
jgi:hypothetical protein